MLNARKASPEFEPLLVAAQAHVQNYFDDRTESVSDGTIKIGGQRYILVRGASLSVDLFELMMERYKDAGRDEAVDVARSFLFDIAHTIGKMDARSFHKRMGVQDPMEKHSIGPLHFAHSGWASVEIQPESHLTPDENFVLVADHLNSFEAEAWIKAGRRPDFPVCVMSAGYAAGWCEGSFDVPLQAIEVTCKARGDETCRFVVAPPAKIDREVQDYLKKKGAAVSIPENYGIINPSKRKRIEEDLLAAREENRKLATVASCTRSSVLILNADWRIDWVNEGFVRLNQHSFEQVRNREWIEFLASCQTDPESLDWVRAHIQNKQRGRLEMACQTSSGDPLWLDVEVQPILGSNGDITSVIVIETDVTERREAQDKQARLLDQIEKANRELTDFAYIISHDLKAPLRAIKNLVTWISEDCHDTLEPESQEQMELLTGRVDRMQMLIDGVLQYSRAGRSREKTAQIDLNGLLTDVLEMLDPPAHIAIKSRTELPTIYGEPTRIQQIFQNLLSNAIKYMDKPEGQVIVDSLEQEDCWQFSVTDNGPGIEERHFGVIFDMFKTLQPRDEVESTGVGLTVVKKVVEYYGGRVWVESTVGEGTTFFFTLAKEAIAPPRTELAMSTV